MSIKNVPLSPARPVPADTALTEVIDLILGNDVNHVPVCSTEGRYLGMVGIADILEELVPASARGEHALQDLAFAGDCTGILAGKLRALRERSLQSVIRTETPSLRNDAPLLEAVLLLTRQNSPLPVLDEDGRLIGMLSRRNLLRYLITSPEVR